MVVSSKQRGAMGSWSGGAGPRRGSPGREPRAGEGKETETDPPGPRHPDSPSPPEPAQHFSISYNTRSSVFFCYLLEGFQDKCPVEGLGIFSCLGKWPGRR